jgi:hypothetical protein
MSLKVSIVMFLNPKRHLDSERTFNWRTSDHEQQGGQNEADTTRLKTRKRRFPLHISRPIVSADPPLY